MQFSGDYDTIGEYFKDTPPKSNNIFKTTAKSSTNDNGKDSLNNVDKSLEQQTNIFSQIVGLFRSDRDLNKNTITEIRSLQKDIGKTLDKFSGLITEKNKATSPLGGIGKFSKVASLAAGAGSLAFGAESLLPERANPEIKQAKVTAQTVTPSGVAPPKQEEPNASGMTTGENLPIQKDNSNDKTIAKVVATFGGVWKSLEDVTKNSFDSFFDEMPKAKDVVEKIKSSLKELLDFASTLTGKVGGIISDAAATIKEHMPSLDDVKSGVNKAVDAVGDLGKKAVNAITGRSSTPASAGKTEMENYLNKALDEQNVTDPKLRAGIAAVSIGESGFKPQSEQSYSGSSNERIRSIFRTKLGDKSDAEIDAIKADPKKFFNTVYGGVNGNKEAEDGYNYRGRGLNQLTGRSNYEHIGKVIGVDLVSNPDLANDPEVAAKIAVAYSKERYHGGGFEEIKRGVGNPVASTEARENAAYAEYTQSGRFNAGQHPEIQNAAAVAPSPAGPLNRAPDVAPANTATASNDRTMPNTPKMNDGSEAATPTDDNVTPVNASPQNNDSSSPTPQNVSTQASNTTKGIFDDLGLGVNDIPLHINSNGVVVVGSSALY